MEQHIVFKLIDENYIVKLSQIKEILVYEQIIITPLFHEQPWIKGVINLRGEVIPIIDLRVRFNADEPIYNEHTIVIVVKTAEEKLVSVVVDEIEAVIDVDTSKLSQSPDIGVGIEKKYLKGLIKLDQAQMAVLLDIDKILEIEELV
jgi:purine-binding chemotaxis protein CheW